ncbi:hypothetical protein FZ025_15450 [Xanthomonas hyacinthi]|uniref:Uncharacterized protein n=1 Tax=Xanthomonas hyacinthi TaxID=56455 RepID=A0A2S7EUU2_9XANT|nr:hypothetical protein [Xanthomonas hyacinthi]KLD78374.1 hypothetical protein Y886_10610 [Xanthomonas hyacinthi DSM 19077]PPU96900.1 hypothetical protein XhyaCFBP1156_12725 [Xanthomonas hyacinthi]QGY77957.1 hypothetical protein FZ025_15450 [Xanthomonas hyacinthi]
MSEPASNPPATAAAPTDPLRAFADGVRSRGRSLSTEEAVQLMAFVSRTQSARQACPLLVPSAASLRMRDAVAVE